MVVLCFFFIFFVSVLFVFVGVVLCQDDVLFILIDFECVIEKFEVFVLFIVFEIMFFVKFGEYMEIVVEIVSVICIICFFDFGLDLDEEVDMFCGLEYGLYVSIRFIDFVMLKVMMSWEV